MSLEIHRTLQDICLLTLKGGEDAKKGSYLLIIIDDLDRCGIDTVKEVLDAVRLVAHIPRVVTLVAIDERMAFAAVEKHYVHFASAGRPPSIVARDYLAKIFQVSISLPETNDSNLKSYISETMFVSIDNSKERDGFSEEMLHEFAENGESFEANEMDNKEQEYELKKQSNLDSNEISEGNLRKPLKNGLKEEKALFEVLALSFDFKNPRLLWRLYMAWKLLKSLYFSSTYNVEEISIPMRILFWQEWLHTLETKEKIKMENWMRNSGNQQKPDTLPASIYDEVYLDLRPKYKLYKDLFVLVNTVLLPSVPNTDSQSLN